MIGRLRGQLLAVDDASIVIDVAGVGYEVEVTTGTRASLPRIGEVVQLYTHLSIREDAHALYGFHSMVERDLFRMLIKVSNIGPKLALNVLSGIDVPGLARCVKENDLATLVKLPGVGRKTAERLVIELKDRIERLVPASRPAMPTRTHPTVRRIVEEAESALQKLGYRPAEASRAVSHVLEDGLGTPDMATEEVVRRALQRMATPHVT